jgi:hypothetical protein
MLEIFIGLVLDTISDGTMAANRAEHPENARNLK